MEGAPRTPLPVRPGLPALLAATAAVAVAVAVAGFATWGNPASAQAAMMRIGARPARASEATVTGRLAARTRLRVTVTLKPRRPAALAAYARAVSTPGNVSFRHYLRPGQFGRRFGASPAQISVVRKALIARGLRPGPVSAGHLSIPLRATAAALDRGLAISLLRLALPGRRTAIAVDASPSLVAGAARLVQSIVGLDSKASPRPLLVRPDGLHRTLGQASSSPADSSGPHPCAQARSQASDESAYTADQIAAAYGFTGLYGAGDDGAGVTVAVYELESDSPADIAAYQACYGARASISYVPVDGGAGSGAGSGEAAFDIENLIGLAPAVDVLVYQGPNSDSSAPGSGPYDTFSAIVNQDRARVVTVSWGQCEADLGGANAAAENTLFAQAAVEGQSIVAAAGDSGSEDCATDGDDTGGGVPQTQLAVDDPSSQPYVIGTGGTSLRSIGPPPTESAWNSGTIAAGALLPGAGGGGISGLWPMPLQQRDAAASLNVLGAGATGAVCGRPGGYCREVPDVAADADPATGYLIYFNGNHSQAGQSSGWQAIGGTSGAAPVWAAVLALADASRDCRAGPLGFPGPALYLAASESYGSDFNDVRSGDNDFTASNDGRFAAGPGYDEATGLGSPNAAPLATSLCAGTLRVLSPGAQRSTAHTRVSLHLTTDSSPGTDVRLSATGLPPGLSLNPVNGEITGQPQRTGTFDVSVTAQDRLGARASLVFGWTVGAAPRVSHLAVSGLQQAQPSLAFTLSAGRGAPAFTELRMALPSGLSLSSARDVQLHGRNSARPRFSARLADGGLQITLRHPLSELRLVLAYPDLRIDGQRRGLAHHSRGGTPELDLRIVDTDAGTTVVRTRLAAGAR